MGTLDKVENIGMMALIAGAAYLIWKNWDAMKAAVCTFPGMSIAFPDQCAGTDKCPTGTWETPEGNCCPDGTIYESGICKPKQVPHCPAGTEFDGITCKTIPYDLHGCRTDIQAWCEPEQKCLDKATACFVEKVCYSWQTLINGRCIDTPVVPDHPLGSVCQVYESRIQRGIQPSNTDCDWIKGADKACYDHMVENGWCYDHPNIPTYSCVCGTKIFDVPNDGTYQSCGDFCDKAGAPKEERKITFSCDRELLAGCRKQASAPGITFCVGSQHLCASLGATIPVVPGAWANQKQIDIFQCYKDAGCTSDY